MTELPKIWTDERKDKARAACKFWQGTSHSHWMRIPNVGIDCIHFVVDVMERAGAIEKADIPRYHDNLGHKGADEKLIGEFTMRAPVVIVTVPYEFGDILVFKTNININHVAILIDGLVWHSLAGRHVDCYPFQEFAKMIRCGLRLNSCP